MALELSKEQREELKTSLRRYFTENLEEELSDMQAGFLLEYIASEIAPLAYNRGVEDAQKYLQQKLEDLPGTCFQEQLAFWKNSPRNEAREVRRKPSR